MIGNQSQSDGVVRIFLRALWACRVSLFSTAGALLIFWKLPQARDLFVDIRATPWSTRGFWLLFYIEVALLWLLPVFWGARLALACGQDRIGIDSRHRWILTVMPAGLVMLGILAVGLGVGFARYYLIDAGDKNVTEAAEGLFDRIHLLAAGVVLIVGLIAMRTAIRNPWIWERVIGWGATLPGAGRLQSTYDFLAGRTRDDAGPPKATTLADQVTLVGLALLTGFSALFAVLWAIDPATIAAIFPRALLLPVLLGLWVAPLTLLGALSHRVRLPLIFFLLVAFIAVESLIDNRAVRAVPPAVDKRIALKKAYALWRSTNDCDLPNAKPTPKCAKPIIVAAAGGASRAAFFTASVLGLITDITKELPDEFNEFTDQLFGISAVSGSSLGAASYLALRERAHKAKQGIDLSAFREAGVKEALWFGAAKDVAGRQFPPSWKDALQILMAGDFLSPVAAAGLRDSTPLGLFLEDRADVLAKAWQRRFNLLDADKNPLELSLTSYAPTKDRWKPILYLNGTMVENGRRIIVSPVAASTPPYPRRIDCYPEQLTEFYTDSYDFHDLFNGVTAGDAERDYDKERLITRDVSLAAATLLGARFPIISPHGTIKNAAGRTIGHVVDGGYFENYGALTAADIINGLKIIHTNRDPTAGRQKNCEEETAEQPTSQVQYQEFSDPEENTQEQPRKEKCEEDNWDCLRRAQRLRPLVIQISNDPGTQPCVLDADNEVDPAARVALPVPDRWRFYPSLSFIVDAVLGARVGRGTHATELLGYLLDDDRVGYFAAYDWADPGYAHFRVCLYSKNAKGGLTADKGLRFRDVSMSWWLSKPVQTYLDGQLCNPTNKVAMARVLMGLRKDPKELTEKEARVLFDRYRKEIVEVRCAKLEQENSEAGQKGTKK